MNHHVACRRPSITLRAGKGEMIFVRRNVANAIKCERRLMREDRLGPKQRRKFREASIFVVGVLSDAINAPPKAFEAARPHKVMHEGLAVP